MYGLVISIGISPQYFLDEMSQSELTRVLQTKFEQIKLSWEQTRIIAFYIMVAEHGTKHIKTPEDLFKFEWDKKKAPRKAVHTLEEYKAFADKLINNGK